MSFLFFCCLRILADGATSVILIHWNFPPLALLRCLPSQTWRMEVQFHSPTFYIERNRLPDQRATVLPAWHLSAIGFHCLSQLTATILPIQSSIL
ncbi:hypothetical protein EVA_14345 [gut metagenome]|uniref:Uncharacterized protein n=1 Tax=gut metagenome TaxID=749906 RepID=J9G715_9ZZZZ